MADQASQVETLLSLVQKFTAHDVLQADPEPQNLHQFASGSSEPPAAILRDILEASTVLTNSLTAYLGLPITDPKLVSILRQYGALSHGLHTVGAPSFVRIIRCVNQ